MRPILFVWRGFAVRSFPVMIYLACLTGALVALAAAHARNLHPQRVTIAILLLLCSLFVGARAVYIALNWRAFKGGWRRLFDRSQGGMTFSGGLLVCLLCSPAVLVWLKLPFGLFWDSAGLGMLAGLAVAKTGCLLHGCCYGRPTEAWFGLNLPDHHGVWRRRIPTQLLEGAWSLALLALLVPLGASLRPGMLFCLAVAGYAAPRFIFQSLREDAPKGRTGVFRAALSAAILLVAGYLVWLLA
jgi:phosphatidylglycerol:prolipoprotein diacylglycerol transferase